MADAERSTALRLVLLGAFCSLFLSLPCFAGDVVTWPAPPGEPISPRYRVAADGRSVPVYVAKSRRGADYSFALFDFEGPVTVTVTGADDFRRATVRPSRSGLRWSNRDSKLILTLERPCKISIEPRGIEHPLILFAGTPDHAPPDPRDPNVLYFGPGIHKPGRIVLRAGQTLYLAGGAVVKGAVFASGADGMRIAGRGILDGTDWPWLEGPETHMVHLWDSKNLSVEGITIRGSYSWTVVLRRSQGVTIRDVRIVNGRVQNDDGINPCNSQDVLIDDCFIRTDDDCIALKGVHYLNTPPTPVRNVTVQNCVLWCDRARVFLLGHESQAPAMEHILFRNCDILHYAMTPFLLEPGEGMPLRHVLFENFRVHGQGQSELIRLRPTVNQYMRNKEPGSIRDVTFRNIKVSGAPARPPRVELEGAGEEHRVEEVRFENVTIYGRPLDEASPSLRIGPFVERVEF